METIIPVVLAVWVAVGVGFGVVANRAVGQARLETHRPNDTALAA